MEKLRKTIIGFLFMFTVALGIIAVNSNAKAASASAKNFKGNLNVTYKNSDSKITIKKINSKKVKINVKTSFAEGDFTGKVISNKVIKMNTGSKYAKVSLKWLDKNHFKTIWQEKGENIDNFISNFSDELYNNTKYTQVEESSTVYYSSKGNPYKSVISIKENKVVIKGKLIKGTKKSYADVKGNVTEMKKATRTFTLAKNAKFYGNGGENPKPNGIPYNDAISSIKNKEGLDKLPFILTVKNGKVTRIDFYS